MVIKWAPSPMRKIRGEEGKPITNNVKVGFKGRTY
jgi:hypothetical protein